MKIYTNDLVKGHSDFKVKCLTFGLYTQVSDSGPLSPLVYAPNFGEVEGAYWFGPVRPSVHPSVCLSVCNSWQLRNSRTAYARILKLCVACT